MSLPTFYLLWLSRQCLANHDLASKRASMSPPERNSPSNCPTRHHIPPHTERDTLVETNQSTPSPPTFLGCPCLPYTAAAPDALAPYRDPGLAPLAGGCPQRCPRPASEICKCRPRA